MPKQPEERPLDVLTRSLGCLTGCLVGRVAGIIWFALIAYLGVFVAERTGLPILWAMFGVAFLPVVAGVVYFLPRLIGEQRTQNKALKLTQAPKPLTSRSGDIDTDAISEAFALYRIAEPLSREDYVLSSVANRLQVAGASGDARRELTLLRIAIIQLGIEFGCQTRPMLKSILELGFTTIISRLAWSKNDPILANVMAKNPSGSALMHKVDAELERLKALDRARWERLLSGGPQLWTLTELFQARQEYVAAFAAGQDEVRRRYARGEGLQRIQWQEVGKLFARRLGVPDDEKLRELGATTAEQVFAAPLPAIPKITFIVEPRIT